jgi:transposase
MKDLAALLPAEQRARFLEEVKATLTPAQFETVRAVFEGAAELLGILEAKKISIGRLRARIFGPKTEKGRRLCGGPTRENPGQEKKRPGHGRTSHRRYTGARRIQIPHSHLKAGDPCPDCGRGKLRRQKEPTRTVKVTAQPPVAAIIHEMERLRCDACNLLFKAPEPEEAKGDKYDPTVGVMVGLLRYGSGMPFYRLERLQKSIGVPLPAPVQWEQVVRTSKDLEVVVDYMMQLGAQAPLIHNDDTTMRIADVRKEIEADRKAERTGIFTSGIVCQGLEEGRVSIRILLTGRNHAGENLGRVLDRRAKGLPPPLQMCDGLKHNEPSKHATELCHCNVHARRQFVDIRSSFPEECRKVVETLGKVYEVEAQCRKAKVGPEERLRRHQQQSRPVMEAMRQEFQERMDQKKIEPNSGLGGAVKYLLERWSTLTMFLKVPGAPLDNNETERLLKNAILHRKNSLHYRTQRGADVGDTFMTVIETCRANGVNPFEYMLAIVRNPKAVRADPGRWMPWNYEQANKPEQPPAPTPAPAEP